MKLDSLRFSEFIGEPQEWHLHECTFATVNLVVGKNASGKTRLLNVINGLAQMIRGDHKQVFTSGEYEVRLSSTDYSYVYNVVINHSVVTAETLSRNGTILLERGKNGIGKIWTEQEQKNMDFEAPQNQLVANIRRDSIQHSFFEKLYDWAKLLRHYSFGTPLGRDLLYGLAAQANGEPPPDAEITDTNLVGKLYDYAFLKFGEPFDQAVLRDLAALGYECTDVGIEVADSTIIRGMPPSAWLYVQEKGLRTKTHQMNISQGMFRALALVIHINYIVFRGTPRTVLIDDIGEGLDFSRAQSFISMLIGRAEAHNLQLIMTTNDRFVMNGVPLKHWAVLTRHGSEVKVTTPRNTPRVFNEFEELGLNNFDFFSTNFFEEGFTEQ